MTRPIIDTDNALYVVKLRDNTVFHIGASESEIDAEHGLVFFSKDKTVVAMFKLEDVKCYWRILNYGI